MITDEEYKRKSAILKQIQEVSNWQGGLSAKEMNKVNTAIKEVNEYEKSKAFTEYTKANMPNVLAQKEQARREIGMAERLKQQAQQPTSIQFAPAQMTVPEGMQPEQKAIPEIGAIPAGITNYRQYMDKQTVDNIMTSLAEKKGLERAKENQGFWNAMWQGVKKGERDVLHSAAAGSGWLPLDPGGSFAASPPMGFSSFSARTSSGVIHPGEPPEPRAFE